MVADDLNLDANAWRPVALVRRIPKREERLTAAASAVLEALHVLLGVDCPSGSSTSRCPKMPYLICHNIFPAVVTTGHKDFVSNTAPLSASDAQ